jgi:hypothetical protein
MNPHRRLIPYVLLGILTLGTGLAVGLGLSQGTVTYTATSATSATAWAPCATARNGAEIKVTCGSVVSQLTASSFTYGWHGFASFFEAPWKMPNDFVSCMTAELIHVVPRSGRISSAKLSRDMGAIYASCSGLKVKG